MFGNNKGNDKYVITPKGIAAINMIKCGLIEDLDDERLDEFWRLFKRDMIRHNYYIDEKGD